MKAVASLALLGTVVFTRLTDGNDKCWLKNVAFACLQAFYFKASIQKIK